MKRDEKYYISQLPRKYRPMGAWSYLGCVILFTIPVIGWIFLIVFALNNNNIARRSFARMYFCALLLIVILAAVIAVLYLFVPTVADFLKPYFDQFLELIPKIG